MPNAVEVAEVVASRCVLVRPQLHVSACVSGQYNHACMCVSACAIMAQIALAFQRSLLPLWFRFICVLRSWGPCCLLRRSPVVLQHAVCNSYADWCQSLLVVGLVWPCSVTASIRRAYREDAPRRLCVHCGPSARREHICVFCDGCSLSLPFAYALFYRLL